jgi:hypothetical protein
MKLNPSIPLLRQPLSSGGHIAGFNPQQMQLRGNPLEFNRFYGTIGDSMKTPMAKLRAYYYFVEQLHFPLTPAEFTNKFAASIPLFVDNINPSPGRQTNATFAAGTNEPFVVLGVGVIAIGKGFGFSLPGRMVAAPEEAGTCVPVVDGCPGAGQRDAVLDYGGAHWRFIEAFFNAYRLQMAVWRRYLVLDESLFDVGMVGDSPEYVGAGQALINAAPYIRETNDVLADKGCDLRFLPENHAGTECLGAPTAKVMYGHNAIRGVGNRIFCLNQPICYLPGMRFDLQFTRVDNDACFLPDMERASVLSCGEPILPDANYADEFCNASGFPGVYNVPGGCISLGVVLTGYALTPQAVLDYMLSCQPGSVQSSMCSGNSYGSELLRKANSDPALRHVLAGHSQENVNHFQQMLAGAPQS